MAIDDQFLLEDDSWSFQVPSDSLPDTGEPLTLSASLADGSPLPAWLVFDPEARTFSGTPPQNFNGEIALKLIGVGATTQAEMAFSLVVTLVNDAPELCLEAVLPADSSPGGPHWYGYDPGGLNQLELPVQEIDGRHALVSDGPFWIDPNHSEPGAGFLNLLAIGYSYVEGGRIPLTSLSGLNVEAEINLAGLELPPGAHVYFWFQAIDQRIPGVSQTVNYALRVDIEELAGDGWARVTLELSRDDADWIPLDSNPDRTATYNRSANIVDALEGALIDCGFIAVLGNGSVSAASGQALFSDIRFTPPNILSLQYNGGDVLQGLEWVSP